MIDKWVPCTEKSPPIDEEVLVSDGKYIWMDSLQEDEFSFIWWDNYNDDVFKTAWMPLPNVWEGYNTK